MDNAEAPVRAPGGMKMEIVIQHFSETDILLEKSLGSGGQGEVYLYTAPCYGKVAVKKLGTNDKKWIYTERELLASLKLTYHPNILGFYGFYYNSETSTGERQNGYVMEYMKGGCLWDVAMTRAGEVPVLYDLPQALSWVRQATLGLAFMHKNDIIHRDVKPHNMLLSDNHQTLKISDLGFACDANRLVKTANIGTMGFISPEVLKGGDYGPKTDVYGLGISIWLILNRRDPTADRRNPERLQGEIIERTWRPDSRQLGNFPEMTGPEGKKLTALMESCWHKFQAERPTMQAVLDVVEELCVARRMERTISSGP